MRLEHATCWRCSTEHGTSDPLLNWHANKPHDLGATNSLLRPDKITTAVDTHSVDITMKQINWPPASTWYWSELFSDYPECSWRLQGWKATACTSVHTVRPGEHSSQRARACAGFCSTQLFWLSFLNSCAHQSLIYRTRPPRTQSAAVAHDFIENVRLNKYLGSWNPTIDLCFACLVYTPGSLLIETSHNNQRVRYGDLTGWLGKFLSAGIFHILVETSFDLKTLKGKALLGAEYMFT